MRKRVRQTYAVVRILILACYVGVPTSGAAVELQSEIDGGFIVAVTRLAEDSFLQVFESCRTCSQAEFVDANNQVLFKTQEELAMEIQQASIDFFPEGMPFEELFSALENEIPSCKLFDRPKRYKIQCNIVKTVPAPKWMRDENVMQLPFLIKMKFLSSEDRLTLDSRNVWIELELI